MRRRKVAAATTLDTRRKLRMLTLSEREHIPRELSSDFPVAAATALDT